MLMLVQFNLNNALNNLEARPFAGFDTMPAFAGIHTGAIADDRWKKT